MAIQLRRDIEIIRTGPKGYVVMDRRTGGSFVCTSADRQLIGLLDGVRGPQELRRDYARRFGQDISERHVEEFLEQLRTFGLLNESPEPGTERLNEPESDRQLRPRSPGQKPVPADHLERVNRRFDLLVLFFGWLLHPFWMLPAGAVILVGATALATNFSRFAHELSALCLTVPTLLLIPLSLSQTVLIMNLPRELFIGMACRRFGVRVRRFGLIWVNDTLPFFQCDRGEANRPLAGRAKWTILLSGWWCQMTLGALYTIAWSMAPPQSGIGLFFMLMILPWLLAFVLHFNIFARLDGYKALCVLLDEPLLQERAVAVTRAWLRGTTAPEALSDRKRRWFRTYGLGWYGWVWALRLLYIFGGLYWLILRLDGLGALLGIGAMIVWYRRRIGRLLMKKTGLDRMFRGGGRWWVRWLVRGTVAVGLVVVGLLPYDHTVTGQCRIVPLSETGVRSQIADEIVRIHVREGQQVDAGEVIATLSGRDVLHELEEREAEVREAQAQYDLLLAGPRPEELAMAEQEVELWRIRRDFAESELSRLHELDERGAADPDELRAATREKDSAEQLFLTAQEKRDRVKQGARDEEKAAAKARLEASQVRLSRAQARKNLLNLTSPISGRVATPDVNLREGQAVQPGDLVATIQDTSHLRVEIAADETAARVRVGMPVQVRLTGLDGKLLNGRVQSISPTALADNQFRVEQYRSDREALIEKSRDREADAYHIRLYAELDPADSPLMPGMTGKAKVTLGPDRFWRAAVRPVVRYFRTEVWSWLP
jgi:multidrug efflux pump subunit AcrA (membrane-fusion protein)